MKRKSAPVTAKTIATLTLGLAELLEQDTALNDTIGHCRKTLTANARKRQELQAALAAAQATLQHRADKAQALAESR